MVLCFEEQQEQEEHRQVHQQRPQHDRLLRCWSLKVGISLYTAPALHDADNAEVLMGKELCLSSF